MGDWKPLVEPLIETDTPVPGTGTGQITRIRIRLLGKPIKLKRGRQNISRIENQWRKIEIFLFRQNIPFCELVSKKIF